jgi:hypothetical protein
MTTTLVAAIIAGAVCGLVPLIYGLSRGQTGLAVGGFFACLVGGLILGLILAVPLAVLFAWLIHRKDKARRGVATGAAAEPWAGRPEAVGPAGDDTRFDRAPDAERPATDTERTAPRP